jgi:hypothetical protein
LNVRSVVDEYVPGLEILMYKATPVGLAECRRQANGDTQDPIQIEQFAPLKNQIKGLTVWVHEYEDRPPFVTSERQRLGGPCGVEFGGEGVFVLKPPETLRRWVFRSECYCQDPRCAAVLPAAIKGEVLPESAPARTQKALSWGHSRCHYCTIPNYSL